MALIDIKVPNIGDFADVAVIELLVKPGDSVKVEQSLLTVESDKAAMETPPATPVWSKSSKWRWATWSAKAHWCCCWKWLVKWQRFRLLNKIRL